MWFAVFWDNAFHRSYKAKISYLDSSFKSAFSLVAQMVKNLPAMQETQVRSLGKGRSPGEGNGCPLQYSCLENPMDRVAWGSTVYGVSELDTVQRLTLLPSLIKYSDSKRHERHYIIPGEAGVNYSQQEWIQCLQRGLLTGHSAPQWKVFT